jgi:c-di-GMP-related signal transduction protein
MQSTGAQTELSQEAPRPLRHIARQPILGLDEQVIGYKLLFRGGLENYLSGADSDTWRNALDNAILVGLDVLCDGYRAFVSCSREALLKDYITLLPPTQAGLEILPDVPADDLVVAACQRMKAAGYIIALDDFGVDDPRQPLASYADILNVDTTRHPSDQITALIKHYANPQRRLLAVKVETREEFAAAKKAGFTLFQGNFFRKPEVMQARKLPVSKVSTLRLLQAISKPDVDPSELENIIKSEPSLCYRLLRYLNSPVFGLPQEVHSVRHALAMLGNRELGRWVRLTATLVAAQNKPSDLVLSALVRARFCELLAPKIGATGSDLFLVGLLSLMDAILDVPMGVVLEGVMVDQETKAVLLGQPSRFSSVYDLMVAQEQADWERVTGLAAELHLSESAIAECRWEAMQWGHQMKLGI